MRKFIRGGGARQTAPRLNGHRPGPAGGDSDDLSGSVCGTEQRRAGTLRDLRPWEDADFPPGATALGLSRSAPHPVLWLRPHEVCERPLFSSATVAAERDGVAGAEEAPTLDAGPLADANLQAAAGALALTPRLLDRVVLPAQCFRVAYDGCFRFRFWQFGEWREVAVDDRLPTYRGRLLGLRSSRPDEFWPALLEKAYAKLYGGYKRLRDGSAGRALQDLTGGVVQSFVLAAHPPQLTLQLVNSAVPLCTLLVATVEPEKQEKERHRDGLIAGEAYCVTGLARVRGGDEDEDTPLVRLRGAGRGHWAGAWSRTSDQWRELSARDKELLGTGLARSDFWMSFEDFRRALSRLELVHVGPDEWLAEPALRGKRPWRTVLARRRWTEGYNAGGPPRFADTTATNPQFHVQLAARCHVVVALAQQYEQRRVPPRQAIGFALYEVSAATPRLTRSSAARQAPLDASERAAVREVATLYTLPAGDYVVVAHAARPGVEARFLLRVLTDRPSDVWEVNEDNVVVRSLELEFPERNGPATAEETAAIASLLGKRPPKEVDARGLRRALRWSRWARPSLELCRALLPLRDAHVNGKISARDVPPLLRLLRFWKAAFEKHADEGCASRRTASAYRVRELLRAAGLHASNKVVECVVVRYARDGRLTAEAYVMALARLHLAHERYRSLEAKLKANPLSLEEMILMTVYS